MKSTMLAAFAALAGAVTAAGATIELVCHASFEVVEVPIELSIGAGLR